MGLGKPRGFLEVEAPDFMAIGTWRCKVVNPRQRSPLPRGNIPVTYFSYWLSQPQGHSSAGRIMSMKNLNDTIGNRTRDLPACRAVPQPPRAPYLFKDFTNNIPDHLYALHLETEIRACVCQRTHYYFSMVKRTLHNAAFYMHCLFDVCMTVHHCYNNINNQLDATITVY